MHARDLSCDSQAKLIVRSVVKRREFLGNKKKIVTTRICYARLTQDSRSALNWSRTGKNPFFKFFRPDIWTDLNGCRQRLLFAHQFTQRKCSLCSQGSKLHSFAIVSSIYWSEQSSISKLGVMLLTIKKENDFRGMTSNSFIGYNWTAILRWHNLKCRLWLDGI